MLVIGYTSVKPLVSLALSVTSSFSLLVTVGYTLPIFTSGMGFSPSNASGTSIT